MRLYVRQKSSCLDVDIKAMVDDDSNEDGNRMVDDEDSAGLSK